MFLKIWPSGWLEREKDRTALSPMSSLKQVSTLEGCRHSFSCSHGDTIFCFDSRSPPSNDEHQGHSYWLLIPPANKHQKFRSCAVSGSAPEWADQDSKRITSTRIRTVSGSGSRKPDLIHHFWLILLYNQYSKCLKPRANRTCVSGYQQGQILSFTGCCIYIRYTIYKLVLVQSRDYIWIGFYIP